MDKGERERERKRVRKGRKEGGERGGEAGTCMGGGVTCGVIPMLSDGRPVVATT